MAGARAGPARGAPGLHVDDNGNLWVADSGNHRVQCFSAEGRLLACWGKGGDGWGEVRFPTDIARAPDGCMFVADPQHRCVWKFSESGEALARIDAGHEDLLLLRPGRLAVGDGRLFVGDVGTGTIHVYRLEGGA